MFVGREQELKSLSELLDKPIASLVACRGRRRIGKSTLFKEFARREGLPVAEKKDSTGVCFIGERDFKAFLQQYLPAQPGEMRTPDGKDFGDSEETLLRTVGGNLFTSTTNTTLAAVFTNGLFSPAELKHVVRMASAGMARGIRPAFTSADGDTIYAIAVGEEAERVAASPDVAGAVAATLLEEAIADAVRCSGN